MNGIAYRETWSAQITDLHALVKFVAAHPSHLGLLTANTAALNAQARSLKGQMRIPGVQAVATRDVAAGRRCQAPVIEGYAGSQPLDLNHQERVELARSVWRLAEALLQTREER